MKGLVHPLPLVWCKGKIIDSGEPNPNPQSFIFWARASYGSAYSIVQQHSGRSKKCVRWVGHQRTEERNQQRVTICRSWLAVFEPNGPKMFSDVVTGNVYCFSFISMKDKRSNMLWMAEDEPRSKVFKTGFRSRKLNMFSKSQSRSHCHILHYHRSTKGFWAH